MLSVLCPWTMCMQRDSPGSDSLNTRNMWHSTHMTHTQYIHIQRTKHTNIWTSAARRLTMVNVKDAVKRWINVSTISFYSTSHGYSRISTSWLTHCKTIKHLVFNRNSPPCISLFSFFDSCYVSYCLRVSEYRKLNSLY